jgi:hypothetical protein
MGQQMEQMQAENSNLRKTVTDTTNSMAQMAASRGGAPGRGKVAEAGGGANTPNAIVDNARNMMGVPTGAQLPV